MEGECKKTQYSVLGEFGCISSHLDSINN